MPSNDLELRAAAAVASILNAHYSQRDTRGAPAKTRDFDLIFEDGHIEPLEITESATEAIRNTQGRLRQTERAAPSLKRAWTIDMPNRERLASGKETAYDVRRLLREAEPLLAIIEAEGRTSFDIGQELHSTPEGSRLRTAYDGLLDLGVSTGLSHESPADNPGGRISLMMVYGSTGHGDSLNDVVLAEACKSDNRDKLREPANAPARHLCVVVEPSVGRAYVGLREGMVGAAPETLPPPITTVWAVAGRHVVSVTPPGNWMLHVISNPDVFDHPERWMAP